MDGWQEPSLRIARLIEARYGLSLSLQRDRLQAFFGKHPAKDQARLADHLALAPEHDPVWQDLIEAMLVHETFFFRHTEQLQVVRREVLPLLRQRHRAGITVWCAGCSTGEEAYTLAFLMRETGCPGRILATDLSASSVAAARTGLYRRKPGLNSFRALPDESWRHFDAHPTDADSWAVAPAIRQSVEFKVHNLMTALQSGMSVDLISCRNTLIYFSEDSLRQVEARLVAASRPGTILLLGPAERLRHTEVFVPLTASHPQIFHWPLPDSS